MSENVSLRNNNVRPSVQRFCPLVSFLVADRALLDLAAVPTISRLAAGQLLLHGLFAYTQVPCDFPFGRPLKPNAVDHLPPLSLSAAILDDPVQSLDDPNVVALRFRPC